MSDRASSLMTHRRSITEEKARSSKSAGPSFDKFDLLQKLYDERILLKQDELRLKNTADEGTRKELLARKDPHCKGTSARVGNIACQY